MYVHRKSAGGLFSCEYHGDLEAHRYLFPALSFPARRYRAKAGSQASRSSSGRGQSIRKRRCERKGAPAASAVTTSPGRYRGLGRIGRRKRDESPSCKTWCSSNITTVRLKSRKAILTH